MTSSSTPEKSRRWIRSCRFLVLAAASFLAIGLALFAAFMNRGARSARFAALQDDMTMYEELDVLKPKVLAHIPPPGGVTNMTGIELLSEPELSESFFFVYSETPLFPGFTTTVTFVKGRLVSRELQSPGIRGILEYWWTRVWHR